MAKRGRPAAEIILSGKKPEAPERWARWLKRAQVLALRCRIFHRGRQTAG